MSTPPITLSTFEATASQQSTNNKSLSAHKIESKSSPGSPSECCTLSAPHAKDATPMLVNDKQEIVIRLEIHTDQKPPTSPEQAAMHSVTQENSEKHQLEPTITEINHLSTDQAVRILSHTQSNPSDPRGGTSSYKQEKAIKPLIKVHSQVKATDARKLHNTYKTPTPSLSQSKRRYTISFTTTISRRQQQTK